VSNPTIAAFHTIRAAAGLTSQRPPRPGVHTLPAIIKGPFVPFWRHPIWWWKMRHLRADIRLLESEVDPAFSKRMRELEDEAFLYGKGDV